MSAVVFGWGHHRCDGFIVRNIGRGWGEGQLSVVLGGSFVNNPPLHNKRRGEQGIPFRHTPQEPPVTTSTHATRLAPECFSQPRMCRFKLIGVDAARHFVGSVGLQS